MDPGHSSDGSRPERGIGMSERALNAVLGGMTAAGASAVLNPIDTLKVRLQALDVGASRASVGAHAARIISREGLVRGLWVPGLGPNMAFLGAMSSLKFGIYAPCRDALVAATGSSGKTAATMTAAGLVAGACSNLVTAPLLLIKTRVMAGAGCGTPHAGALAEARAIVAAGGIRALWMGWQLAVARGALISIGHMVGYDAAKTAAIRTGARDGPALHIAAAAVAGFAATALQMPADVLLTRHHGGARPHGGLLQCAAHALRSEGPLVFYRGFGLMFARLTPMIMAGQLLHEQCRRALGLGYIS